MKKAFLAIAIVTVSFAACTSGDTKTDETTTSDTSTVVTMDTAQVITDTTVKMTVTTDTTK
ncbi:MAG: hypothetical protein ABIO55_03690 [Ginsengibacter sp.]